jgi:hypothetical protein
MTWCSMTKQNDDDASRHLTGAGCLLVALSVAVILGSAVPIVTWRDPDTKQALPRTVAIAAPGTAGALCFSIGSLLLRILRLSVWSKPTKDLSDRGKEVIDEALGENWNIIR